MGKSKTKGKERLDKFYHLAKEQGYRSRAAFKIVQLDAKFRFLPSARSLLDLCAAPGSWMQVAVKHMPVGSFVLGVDLFPIKPIRGAISIEEDITTQKCRSSIKQKMNEHGCSMFDVVLHDGSPNIGGAWVQEATTQSALVVDAIKLAVDFLAPKGTLVTKVFRSQDYSAILYCLKQLFDKVEVTKPVASRSASAEIYVVGLRYKAPVKIDPRLLDVKHLFQGAIDPPKVVDVLRGTKQKRNREGYEDGVTILRKVCSASDFIWSETPLDILGSVTSISFEDLGCASIRDHALTTEEIKALCDDLRVLAKQDFKSLLKWRMHIRKALSTTKNVASKATADEEDENKANDDERMLNEMEELTFAMEHKKKRAKKLLAKRQAKDKARKVTGMQVDAMDDGYTDIELFSLASIKDKKGLLAVGSAEFDDDKGEFQDSESEDIQANAVKKESPSDIDSDEEQRRYDEQIEELLDKAYERFVTKEGKRRKRSKLPLSEDDNELWKETNVSKDDDLRHLDHDSEDESDKEKNPLVVPLHEEEELTQEQITEQWFSQDIFAAVAAEGEALGKNDSDDEMEEEQEVRDKKLLIPEKPKQNILHPKEQISNGSEAKLVCSDDFEIVPAEATDESSSSSSSDESEYDSDSKAEILAYAKKMLRKKQREQILDDAYNKYMFDDDNSNLPTWFVVEEKRHRQPIKPVTKEEVAAMKAKFREIDARPAKKVAQAKARRKRVAMRRLEAVRKKANAISDQIDISERSKGKMIDKLYKKAVPKKPKKEYVVAKKGVQVKAGKGKVLVDRRMKKDQRLRGMGRPGKNGGAKKGKNTQGRAGKKDRREKGSSKGAEKKGKKGRAMEM